MNKVVVFGAGMVAGAHVRYLLDHGIQVTVASRTVSKAEELVRGHPNGHAAAVNSDDAAALAALIREHDLAVSLLPYAYHPIVARLCIQYGVHMVTTSYVKQVMADMDADARAAGVILLNEIGVDPGIDHMTAMRVIHKVQGAGGKIASFVSWCGGLPAPEANTNPFGYKFSWSPRGVLLAGKNPAQYLQDGQMVNIPGGELFDHHVRVPVEVEGVLTDFEGYPNRDSLPYMDTYGIRGTRTMFRGTLRNVGWCNTLRKIADLGLLNETPRNDLAGATWADLARKLTGSRGELRDDLATFLKVAPDSKVISDLAWLGLLSDEPLPTGVNAPIDILCARMLAKMQYAPGERDMLILKHEFLAEYPSTGSGRDPSIGSGRDPLTGSGRDPSIDSGRDPSTGSGRDPSIGSSSGHLERITATMVDFGIPHGDTSMARTVGLPAAIGVRLILEGKIALTGVQVPVVPEIYAPVLDELEALGIKFVETWETA